MMNDQLEKPTAQQRTTTTQVPGLPDQIVDFELQTGAPPTLVVDGEVDLSGGVEFRAAIDRLIEACDLDAGPAVIDLSRVTFMDSIGIRELLMGKERAATAQHELVLRAPSRFVVRPLEMSGVDHLFRIESGAASPTDRVSSPRLHG